MPVPDSISDYLSLCCRPHKREICWDIAYVVMVHEAPHLKCVVFQVRHIKQRGRRAMAPP